MPNEDCPRRDLDLARRAKRLVIFNNMITPYTNRLYNALVEARVALAVLSCSAQEATRSWAGTFEPRYSHEILPGIALPRGPNRYAHLNLGIIGALKRHAPDLLVINGLHPSMLIAAAWAAASGTPLALATDGWRRTMPQTPYHRVLRPFILRRCRAVVACGLKGAAYFAEEGVLPGAIFVVPIIPGWDAPETIPGFAERPYHLLWAAQIEDQTKNASFFAELAVALKKRLPELRLRIVGRGSAERRLIARLRDAGIEYRHDRDVSWCQMPEIYASAKVLVLPSIWEPWGLVCNEALQCGVPVVVSPFVGAADDAVISGENGYVCPLALADWIAALVPLVSDHALWATLSENGRRAMRTRTVAASAERFLAMADYALRPQGSVDGELPCAS
jgi:glycosyltransferase involved in cell wall biosynthesis